MELVRNGGQRGLARDDSVQALSAAGDEAAQRHVSALQVFWQRRWIVLGSLLAGVVMAFIYLQVATPIYTTTSRVYCQQSGPKILTDTTGMVAKSDSYLYTQAELLKSTPILSGALDAMNAAKMRTFAKMDNPFPYLRRALDVQVGKKDDLITISLDTPYPEEGAQIVNAVVDAYVTYQSSRNRSTAGEVLKILRKEKEQRDIELSQKAKAMLDFKQSNGALSFEYDKGNIITQRLAMLQDALTKAQLEAIEAKAAYEAAASMASDPEQLRQLVEAQYRKGVFVSNEHGDAALREEIDTREMQLEQIRSIYAEGHRIRRALETAVAELHDKMNRRNRQYAEAYVAAAKQTWMTAQKNADEVRQTFEDQQKAALDLNSKSAEYAKLEVEYKRTEKLCDVIDSRIKELNVTEDAGALNISVLEVAKVEALPTKPKPNVVLLAGLVLGLMAGCSAALLMDWMDDRLRTTEDIQAALDLPVLGVVPHIAAKGSQDTGQLLQMEPGSDTAEAFRTIRTAVLFGIPAGEAKSILITSPTPGDGKTTTAANLAIAMAQAGQRVLLIDADFRKPRQHVLFDLQNGEAGLSGVLAGRVQLTAALFQTATEGLTVLPCGPIPPNPAELLQGQAFADFLAQIATQYNQVIIDSAPVMPVTDARILGAQCDVTILVLRAEKSTRRVAGHAREGLLSVGARLLGVVVNDVPRKRQGYGYGYAYGYGYGGYGSHSRRARSEEEAPRALAGNGAEEEA